MEPLQKREPQQRILVIGQTCWDQIVLPSGSTYDRVGGSVYYVSRAIRYIARLMRKNVQIDVWAHVGEDFGSDIETAFDLPGVNRAFHFQERTLRFLNRYTNEVDWTQREQEVLQTANSKIRTSNIPREVAQELKNRSYQVVFILPLTPGDFSDLTNDMIPFLRAADPDLEIAVELQGFTRGFPPGGGQVTMKLDPGLLSLLQHQAISCAHCSVDEGRFLLQELAKLLGRPAPSGRLNPPRIGSHLARHGIKCCGVTNGGKGSLVAWRDAEGGFPTQSIPTPNISSVVKEPRATGAGDTWFGILAYLLLALRFPVIVSGCLATQFATLKCLNPGALGEHADGTPVV